VFLGVTAIIPRLSALGRIATRLSASEPVARGPALALAAGTALFALGLLALAVARFERKDY
jgi:hypothetical protein